MGNKIIYPFRVKTTQEQTKKGLIPNNIKTLIIDARVNLLCFLAAPTTKHSLPQLFANGNMSPELLGLRTQTMIND